MSEPVEENHTCVDRKSKDVMDIASSIVDVDLDLHNSLLTLDEDQINFVSNPMSPFLISSPERSFCPLWSFSDADYNNIIADDLNVPLFLKRNPNSETENTKDNEKRKLLPSPLQGLMPLENPNEYCSIKEKLTLALRYLKESMSHQRVLAQVWAPVNIGGRHVLTTSGQPFVQYRMVSLMYMFSVDGENDGEFDLPGRVFLQKLPEYPMCGIIRAKSIHDLIILFITIFRESGFCPSLNLMYSLVLI